MKAIQWLQLYSEFKIMPGGVKNPHNPANCMFARFAQVRTTPSSAESRGNGWAHERRSHTDFICPCASSEQRDGPPLGQTTGSGRSKACGQRLASREHPDQQRQGARLDNHLGYEPYTPNCPRLAAGHWYGHSAPITADEEEQRKGAHVGQKQHCTGHWTISLNIPSLFIHISKELCC